MCRLAAYTCTCTCTLVYRKCTFVLYRRTHVHVYVHVHLYVFTCLMYFSFLLALSVYSSSIHTCTCVCTCMYDCSTHHCRVFTGMDDLSSVSRYMYMYVHTCMCIYCNTTYLSWSVHENHAKALCCITLSAPHWSSLCLHIALIGQDLRLQSKCTYMYMYICVQCS